MKLKELWRKVKNFFRKLLGKPEKVYGHQELPDNVIAPRPVAPSQPDPQPASPPPPPPAPPPQPEPPKDPYNGMPPGEYVGHKIDDPKHKYNNWEPLKTEKADRVDSFLWKPVSDNTDLPVVVVSCDKVRRGDLYIEIYANNWNPISTGKPNHNGDSRGNRIHVYARINFYFKVNIDYLRAYSPFHVKLYQIIEGQKHYLQIGTTGLDYFTVLDPAVRMDYRWR